MIAGVPVIERADLLSTELNYVMSVEDDLKLIRQVLTARSVPVAPETFDSTDASVLFNDLVAIRQALFQFSRGNFDFDVTGRDICSSALKALQANLRHLSWQAEQIGKGDFSQRVEFMGEFSTSFNSMAKQLERLLNDFRSAEERWSLAVQCSRDGIVDVNIDERTAWYSDSFMQMMRYSPADIPQDLHWTTMVHPDDSDQAEVLTTILKPGGVLRPFSEEFRLRTGLGNYLWVLLRGMPVRSENVRRFIAVVSDISAHKETEETLMRRAMYDNLTGLPNRYLLNDRLKQVAANSERSGRPFIFMMFDLDTFKEVNDLYGHTMGDSVLVELAKRLNVKLRSTDTVARIGGDEFVAVYPCEPGTERATTETILQRFYDSLQPPVMLGDVAYQIHSSVGVAFFPKHTQDLAVLFEHADTAMYKAKKKGKNQYVIYDLDTKDRACCVCK